MRDVAVVAFAQSHCTTANLHDDMAEILLPVVRDALAQADLRRTDIDFYASGSHDFFEGRTFAYIESSTPSAPGRRYRNRMSKWMPPGPATRRGPGSNWGTATSRWSMASAGVRCRPTSTR